MTGAEYVEACKQRTKAKSYYQLAIELDISEQELSFYRHGQRLPSLYACFKFAECLGISPSIIMADIASETEKNIHKRNYFKSFMLACQRVGKTTIYQVAFSIGLIGVINSGSEALRIMYIYAKRHRLKKTF